MALNQSSQSFKFDDNCPIMIIKVPKYQANFELIKQTLFDVGIGNVYDISIYGPFENKLFRIEVQLHWFDTEIAHNWQETIMNPKENAYINITLRNYWILIKPPNYYKNVIQHIHKDFINNNTIESELLTMDNKKGTMRTTASLQFNEIENISYNNNTNIKNKESTCEYTSIAIY